MKKIALLLVAAILLGSQQLRADEGMWLLPLLEKFNIKEMKRAGCKLSAKEIYNINNTSLKDAIVALNGGSCTAEVISNNGLLATNHHCGYAAIQALSSVEHDYLKNGYWAMNNSQELPAKGYSVTFIKSFEDVTDIIKRATQGATSPKERDSLYKAEVRRLTAAATEGNKYLDAKVSSMYADNVYYLITTQTFKDIRFVGAPPSSIGKFGYDTDNWVWPRHTGDFSLFRIYADKDNNPAEYSEENVPYKPKRALTISLAGVKENDYTMIMGFPGRTQRYLTSIEAQKMQEVDNKIRIELRGIRQDILMEDMQADPKVMIQYASKFAGSSNGWKKWIGMNAAFDKLKVIERRAESEKEFTEWVNANPQRVEKYGKALPTIAEAVNTTYTPAYSDMLLMSESIFTIELMKIGSIVGGKRKDKMARAEQFFKDYSLSTDKKVAKRMIKLCKERISNPDALPAFYKSIDSLYAGNCDEYVDSLYAQSRLTSLESFKEAMEDEADVKKDPAVLFYRDMFTTYMKCMHNIPEHPDYEKAKSAYMAGIMEMRGNSPIYPDANSTLRLTYGHVKPYSPKDAVNYSYITTLKGVMEKEDPKNWEFEVPEKLKELYRKRDFVNPKYGSYALPSGDVPVAFISTNDITGGNSGSPIMNAKGELIGLAFDGNIESMSSDVLFEPELQRCISVDIRYVLFIIDKFGGAGWLLDEMKIVK